MSRLYSHVHRLWLFSLIAQHLSFKRAALEAGITQSALSQHLKTLEAALGQTLVVRSRSSLSLTDEGTRVVQEVAPILGGLDAMSSRARVQGRAPTRMRLGAYESVALTYLPRLVGRLSAQNRDLTVRIRVGRTALLQTLVREGELDMAVLDARARAPLDCVPLTESRLGLYRAKTDTEGVAAHGVLRVGNLSFGGGDRPDYFLRFVEHHERSFLARGVEMRTVVQSDSFEILRSMAVVGAIVAVLPQHVAERRSGELVEIPLEGVPADCRGRHTLYLASGPHANRRLRDAVKARFENVVA